MFEAENVQYKPDPSQNPGGQRRSMVQAYYNGLDFSDTRDASKFLNVGVCAKWNGMRP